MLVFCTGYIDEGDPVYACPHCEALLWQNERIERDKPKQELNFSLCCSKGKVKVPYLEPPPPILQSLFFDKHTAQSRHFLDKIRSFNNMFSFTSMGGKINTSLNLKGKGPYTFVLSGQNYHYLGSLLPNEGCKPVYSQLYIHDTENEVSNRISAARYQSLSVHI